MLTSRLERIEDFAHGRRHRWRMKGSVWIEKERTVLLNKEKEENG
jgi:hypothetical protein